MTAKFHIKDNEEQFYALEKAIRKQGYLRGGEDPSPIRVANELPRLE